MTIEQLESLIELRTSERKSVVKRMEFVRTNVGLENARDRLRELNEELADLNRQKSQLMEAAA